MVHRGAELLFSCSEDQKKVLIWICVQRRGEMRKSVWLYLSSLRMMCKGLFSAYNCELFIEGTPLINAVSSFSVKIQLEVE